MQHISKKHMFFLIIPIAIVLLIFMLSIGSTSQAASPFVVVINPGHGPSSIGSGATVNNVKESTLNEQTAQKLYEALSSRGYKVYITNKMTQYPNTPAVIQSLPADSTKQYEFGTELLPATNTPWIMNPSYTVVPDLAITLHHNSTTGSSAKGYELYYSSRLGGTYNKAQQSVDKACDFAHMVDNQFTSGGFYMQRRFAPRDIETVSSVNSLVTYSSVPTILVESGFMTNPTEFSNIRNANNQAELANRIANAVDQYAAKYPSDKFPPVLESISTSQSPTYTPAFEITTKITDSGSGVQSVQFAVWSDKNGQDDLKWYSGVPQGNDIYKMYFSALNDHNNDPGIYHIHVYATDNSGNRKLVGQTTTTLLADTTPPTATRFESTSNPCYDSRSFSVAAKGVTDTQSGVKNVRFAVWTQNNGQDDLKWYDGINEGAGGWFTTVNIANHNNELGIYNIHVYAYDHQGNQALLYTKTMDVRKDSTPPTATRFESTANPTDAASFSVAAKGVNDTESGVKNVRFAVWTQNNGQDDLKWYDGINEGAGGWFTTVNIANHKNEMGIYNVHVYAYDKAGNQALLYTKTMEVRKDITPPTAKSFESAIHIKGFSAAAKGVADTGSGVKSVRFAVWSDKNGQDDLKWYDGIDAGSGGWFTSVNIADHKNEYGLYNVHVYATDNAGNQGLVLTKTVTVYNDTTPPQYTDKLAVSPNGGSTSYAFNGTAGFVDNESGIKSVRFAVWSDKNGQDDIKWYEAKNIGNNKWQFSTSYLQHKRDTGLYHIHLYAYDNNGNGTCYDTATINVIGDKEAPTIANASPDSAIVSGRDFGVSVTGVTDIQPGFEGYESGVKNVRFAVWNDTTGQAKTLWIDGVNQGNGTWRMTDSVSKHNNDSGKYTVQVYTYDNAGNSAMRSEVTLTVTNDFKAPVCNKLNLPASTAYKFTASADVTDNMSGVKNVQFAVWCDQNGQDDLTWYNVPNTGGSTYAIEIDYKNHKMQTGVYNVHVYGEDKAGNRACLQTATLKVTGDKSAPTIQSATPDATTVSGKDFGVTITGVTDIVAGSQGYESGVKNVRFAVWSEVNGQDDLTWIDGTNQGNGTWRMTDSITKHKNDSGKYNIHVYTYDNAGNSALCSQLVLNMTGDFQAPTFIGMDFKNASPAYVIEPFADITDNMSGVKNVQFAVWSDKEGSSNLKWYDATSMGGMRYAALIDYRNHGKTTGVYNIELYATDNAGNRARLFSTKIFVSGDTVAPTCASLVSSASPVVGSGFTVTANGVTDIVAGSQGYESGVKNVRFAVWSDKNGQDDLRWYDGIDQGSGKWSVAINIANHNGDNGIYHIHAYGYDNAGNSSVLKTLDVQIVSMPIMGASSTTADQLVRYYTSKVGASTYPAEYVAEGVDLNRFCALYIEAAAAEGVRTEVAFAQAMKETGWLRYGGQVGKMQYNFAGLGALDGGAQGFDFRNAYGPGEAGVRAGILGQIQHLKCYASTDALNQLNGNGQPYDPRWDNAINKYGRGSAPYVEMLGGKWASDPNYGYSLSDMVINLLNY